MYIFVSFVEFCSLHWHLKYTRVVVEIRQTVEGWHAYPTPTQCWHARTIFFHTPILPTVTTLPPYTFLYSSSPVPAVGRTNGNCDSKLKNPNNQPLWEPSPPPTLLLHVEGAKLGARKVANSLAIKRVCRRQYKGLFEGAID